MFMRQDCVTEAAEKFTKLSNFNFMEIPASDDSSINESIVQLLARCFRFSVLYLPMTVL